MRISRTSFPAVFLIFVVAIAVVQSGEPQTTRRASSGASDSRPNREVTGIIVDLAGFPVSNAHVDAAERNISRGARTDASGRFNVPDVPGDAHMLLAWSQRAGRMAVIPIAREMPGDRRYPLDLHATTAEGFVVDPNNKLVEGAEVTFHVSGPHGISFAKKMWQKTQADGIVHEWRLPGGPGWAVSVSLAEGVPTPAMAMANLPVEFPNLVQKAPVANASAETAPAMHVYSGRVVDEQGKPISGAKLEFSGRGTGSGTVTGADGRWSRRMRADLADFQIRLDHADFIGFEFDLRQPTPPVHALRDGSAIQVMKRGFRVSGAVRDSTGAPVGNALVLAGESYSTTPGPPSEPIEDSTATRTARDGTFSIGGIPAGLRHLLVLAEDFAPARVPVTMSENLKPIDIVLDRGRVVTGRIVDEAGNPISDVRVGAERWTLPNAYAQPIARFAVSGADGRFTLPAMPRQGSIEGFANGRRKRLSISFTIFPGSDDVGDVPLYPNPIVAGKVIDDETGTPITKFTVNEGYLDADGRFHPGRDEVVNSGRGEFERTINWMIINTDREIPFAVKVSAIGYRAAMTPTVTPGRKFEPVVIRLKRAAPIVGSVATPDDKPAGKATIYFVGPENDVQVVGTTLNDNLSFSPDVRTTANDEGSFELASHEQNGRLLMLHEAGYAIVPTDDWTSGQITALVPWARIEGSYRPGGKPRAAVPVSAEAIRPMAAMDSRDRLTFALNTTTDGAGRFVIEHVPAMQLRIGAQAAFGPAAAKTVQVARGKTNTVTLADDGPAVQGQVDLSPVIAANPPVQGASFDTSTSWLRAIRVDLRPQLPAGADADDWESQIKSVIDGSATEELTLPATFADLTSDGSFAFDALAPGKYVVLVAIHGERPPQTCGWGLTLARGRAEFTVADLPVTLPPVELIASSHPNPGGVAPEVTGKTATGELFSLNSLQGKFVAIDFWAGWCAPCRASQPELRALHARYKDKVAFVGLNFDYSDTKAKKAIESIKLPWVQVLVGPWDANNAVLAAYGVEVIPSVWLIDPQGKVMAKHLTAEELGSRLAELFTQPE
jgi:thiol-disulfide isomerase/thioredoxin